MIYQIPPATTDQAFTQETTLDGVVYKFVFRWNVRESAWYFDLKTTDDVVLAGGLKLVAGASLLRYIVDSRRPPGVLLVQGVPTVDNLGADAVLLYMDEEEASTYDTDPTPAVFVPGPPP